MKPPRTGINNFSGATVTSLWLWVLLGVVLGSAPAQARVRAYVSNSSPGSVSVIDVATNIVVATVTVRRGPVAVAVQVSFSDCHGHQHRGGDHIDSGFCTH